MSRHKIESVITQRITEIYSAKDLATAKELLRNLLNESKIKDIDRDKMLAELDKITTLKQVQFYATNCMFKFEGLGID
jgi:DNA-binding transcriptional regulator YhcF (GntR family)